MKKLDDYYANLAKSRDGHRNLRDVVPNGEDFRSRSFGVIKEGSKPGTFPGARMDKEYYVRIASTVPCPVCDTAEGKSCVSTSIRTPGKELAHPHVQRITQARHSIKRPVQARASSPPSA